MAVRRDISRISKAIVDKGDGTFPEAEAALLAQRLEVRVAAAQAREPAAQAAVLTAVLTGARCFPGGVSVGGAVDVPLVLPVPVAGRTLREAAVELGASPTTVAGARSVLVGDLPRADGWGVHAWWDGWIAGVEPSASSVTVGDGALALVGAAAGALAVGAAFRAARGDLSAGRAAERTSLWCPGDLDQPGPSRFYLPDALWMIGLGNLGQAYLWALSLLPYADPTALALVLQDEDVVKEENWGTSVLVRHREYGALKTRLAEAWALRRGFRVRRVDRWLDAATILRDADPPMALSGLDRIEARRLLAGPGFERVVDCGLGATAEDYDKYRVTVYDPEFGAIPHLRGQADASPRARNLALDAYDEEGVAGCGAAELAGASVAVPFVSAFVATLAVAQAIRVSCGLGHARSVVGRLDGSSAPRVVQATAAPSRIVGHARAA